jgi:hypothetical protein
MAADISPAATKTRSDASTQHVDLQFPRWVEPDVQSAQDARNRRAMSQR